MLRVQEQLVSSGIFQFLVLFRYFSIHPLLTQSKSQDFDHTKYTEKLGHFKCVIWTKLLYFE